MNSINESLETMITRIVFDAVNSALKINNLAQITARENGQETPLGVAEAATITNLSKKTIYKLVCQGKIPYTKGKGKLYFFKSELLKWLTEAPEVIKSNIQDNILQDEKMVAHG